MFLCNRYYVREKIAKKLEAAAAAEKFSTIDDLGGLDDLLFRDIDT